MRKYYDFEELCPHCDYVNEVKWDGESMTTVCKNCYTTIKLCSLCDAEDCENCKIGDVE